MPSRSIVKYDLITYLTVGKTLASAFFLMNGTYLSSRARCLVVKPGEHGITLRTISGTNPYLHSDRRENVTFRKFGQRTWKAQKELQPLKAFSAVTSGGIQGSECRRFPIRCSRIKVRKFGDHEAKELSTAAGGAAENEWNQQHWKYPAILVQVCLTRIRSADFQEMHFIRPSVQFLKNNLIPNCANFCKGIMIYITLWTVKTLN